MVDAGDVDDDVSTGGELKSKEAAIAAFKSASKKSWAGEDGIEVDDEIRGIEDEEKVKGGFDRAESRGVYENICGSGGLEGESVLFVMEGKKFVETDGMEGGSKRTKGSEETESEEEFSGLEAKR